MSIPCDTLEDLQNQKIPNLNRQKTFIIENSNILNREIKVLLENE